MEIKTPHVIKLGHPVEHGSDVVEELHVERRMIAGDLTGIPASGQTVDHLLTVASRLTGQPMRVMKNLDMEDCAEVIKVITEFLAPFREIGSE